MTNWTRFKAETKLTTQLRFFCPLWGSENLPFEVFAEKVKAAGYDGIEIPLGQTLPEKSILTALGNQGLGFIAQHYETASPDPQAHLTEYCHRLENLASAKPLLINTQTGKDWFSKKDNQRLIAVAHEISARTGVKIVHETHRGKFSFCAQSTASYLETDVNLRLAVDFSHWCVVSESLLEDQTEAVNLAITRADHIHARIGHPQGPQVTDPRAPEWGSALNAHLGWWDQIISLHRQKGTEFLTITPEFGPAPYMPALPYTCQPVADQWTLNQYMLNFLRQRYA